MYYVIKWIWMNYFAPSVAVLLIVNFRYSACRSANKISTVLTKSFEFLSLFFCYKNIPFYFLPLRFFIILVHSFIFMRYAWYSFESICMCVYFYVSFSHRTVINNYNTNIRTIVSNAIAIVIIIGMKWFCLHIMSISNEKVIVWVLFIGTKSQQSCLVLRETIWKVLS